jgi:hypothetical protein
MVAAVVLLGALLCRNSHAGYKNAVLSSTGYTQVGGVTVSMCGGDRNPAYGWGWRLLYASGSYFTIAFNLPSSPTSARIYLEHLSSTVSGSTLNGRSKVNIAINGYHLAIQFDPGNHGTPSLIDRFDVTKYLRPGGNIVKITTSTATSHYWLRKFELYY